MYRDRSVEICLQLTPKPLNYAEARCFCWFHCDRSKREKRGGGESSAFIFAVVGDLSTGFAVFVQLLFLRLCQNKEAERDAEAKRDAAGVRLSGR